MANERWAARAPAVGLGASMSEENCEMSPPLVDPPAPTVTPPLTACSAKVSAALPPLFPLLSQPLHILPKPSAALQDPEP